MLISDRTQMDKNGPQVYMDTSVDDVDPGVAHVVLLPALCR